MWAGGAQNAAPMGSQGNGKDSRPLRDKSFQAKMRQDIVGWLTSNGIDITSQVLLNITSKDFRMVFQHLVQLLDPEWPFNNNKDQRFEEQFVQPLQAFRYPSIGQIDLKILATPGAMHAWPSLLGVLHWLAEAGKASYRKHPIAQSLT